jgi:hypothetical protein
MQPQRGVGKAQRTHYFALCSPKPTRHPEALAIASLEGCAARLVATALRGLRGGLRTTVVAARGCA